MPRTRTIAAALAAAATAALLSGCSVLTGPEQDPLDPIAQCAYGHVWNADLAGLAEQLLPVLRESVDGTEMIADGTLNLEWSGRGSVAMTADYAMTGRANWSGGLATVTERHTGTVTGGLLITDEIAVPKKWNTEELSTEVTSDIAGAAQEQPQFALPQSLPNDVVGLEVTCEDTTLTTHARGADSTITWTR